MERKIIIQASETITCPQCSHAFALDKGITRQTIQGYEDEFNRTLTEQSKALEADLAMEADRKAAKAFTDQIKQLTAQLDESRQTADDAKAAIATARLDEKTKAKDAYESERKALSAELAEKDKSLKEMREQELALRAEQKKIQDERANMQLEVERKLAAERKAIEEHVTKREAEHFSLKEAEYKKKLEDAERGANDLRRRLEQGSQQLQGEVLELEIENSLIEAFRHDLISEVKKGQRGADIIQEVCTPSGQSCGKIIWEAKRAENWSDAWMQKLKDDQKTVGAQIAVLVTTSLPKGVADPFIQRDGVWIVPPHLMRPVAHALRATLLETQRIKAMNTGREEKADLLYQHINSEQFAFAVRTLIDTFVAMQTQLHAEKRAYTKQWATRETQINRVIETMAKLVGDVQGIAQDALPRLNDIQALTLSNLSFDDNAL